VSHPNTFLIIPTFLADILLRFIFWWGKIVTSEYIPHNSQFGSRQSTSLYFLAKVKCHIRINSSQFPLC